MSLFPVYPLFPVELVRGEGSRVYDKEGTEYLDLYGGHAVISVGHSHPTYVKAIQKQAEKLVFYSNSVENSIQQRYAESLTKISGLSNYQVFLVNSGAEANENALKLASFHTGKSTFISFEQAFHGRTTGAVALTDNPKILPAYGQQLPTVRLPLNDSKQVEEHLKKGDIAGIIIEGILGIAGIVTPNNEFMQQLRNLCTQYNVPLILDEVQSGFGRSGKFFAYQHFGIEADIISCAKGMGNGFPIGGILIHPKFEASYGMLGTTFGGNHLACSAAQAVLDIIENEKLIENAKEVGEYFRQQATEYFSEEQIRGTGLMLGLDLKQPIADIRKRLIFNHHIFTGSSSNKNVIRILPPLTITKKEIDQFFIALQKELKS